MSWDINLGLAVSGNQLEMSDLYVRMDKWADGQTSGRQKSICGIGGVGEWWGGVFEIVDLWRV